jgi:hypothetical protein
MTAVLVAVAIAILLGGTPYVRNFAGNEMNVL